MVFVNIFNGTDHLIVAATYLPPSSSSIYYSDCINNIQNTLKDYIDSMGMSKIVIMDDFNIPGYNWLKK